MISNNKREDILLVKKAFEWFAQNEVYQEITSTLFMFKPFLE